MGLTPSARVEGLGGEAAEERGERVSSMRATSMIRSSAHFAWHKQQTGHRKTGYCTTVIQSCTTVVRRNYYRYSMGVWELVVCGCFGSTYFEADNCTSILCTRTYLPWYCTCTLYHSSFILNAGLLLTLPAGKAKSENRTEPKNAEIH